MSRVPAGAGDVHTTGPVSFVNVAGMTISGLLGERLAMLR